jgi:hypothetical protein
MQRTFEDSYRAVRASRGPTGLAFWLGVIVDELRGIVREHLAVAGAPGGPLALTCVMHSSGAPGRRRRRLLRAS